MEKLLYGLMVSVLCLLPMGCFAGLADCPTVAVLGFADKTVNTGNNYYSSSGDFSVKDASVVSDFIVDELINSQRFNVIERERLHSLIGEHELNINGLTAPGTSAQFGKLSGVEYLVYGIIANLSVKENVASYSHSVVGSAANNQHKVIANVVLRFIDVATGRIVLSCRGEGASTSTSSEFSLSKRKQKQNYDTDGFVYTNPVEDVITQTLKIGTVEVSATQAHNALMKASEDAIYGKLGLLNRIDGKVGMKVNKKYKKKAKK